MALFDNTATQAARRIAWTTEKGNSIAYFYYDGVFDGRVDDTVANPSGAKNLKYEVYYDGREREIFRIRYTWNRDNTIASELCL